MGLSFSRRLLHAFSPLLLASASGYALDDVALPALRLRTGDVAPAQLPNLLTLDRAPSAPVVILLNQPMSRSVRASLDAMKVTTLGYLPDSAFIADVSGSDWAAVKASAFISRVVAYRDEWKLDPRLSQPQPPWQTPERQALAAAGKRVISLWLFADRGPDAVRAEVVRSGGTIASQELVARTWCITCTVNDGAVKGLAALGDVQWAEPFSEFTERSNSLLRGFVQSGSTSSTPFYDAGIHGEGEILGVIDSRINMDHCSFSDPEGDPVGPLHRKIEAYNTSVGSVRHGTHVACIAVGDGGTSGDTRGIAYLSRLVYNIHPDATEASMFDRFSLHGDQGARIHTNSWGADGVRAYDGPCRAIDAFQHDNGDHLIIFAVSNSSVVYNPENAKNSLAVGAAGPLGGGEQNICVGGQGPTSDGRRKPEIMSVGCNVTSAFNSTTCGTLAQTGTSMAAPGVAGAALLTRQYFREGFYPSGLATPEDAFIPSGQLVKAMLINGARDMTGVSDFPNVREGWGRVEAGRSAYFSGDARRLAVRDLRTSDLRALQTGETHVWNVSVVQGQELKVTLAWADAPAQVNAALAPVNDLNLEVQAPDGTLYLGNVFSGGVSVSGGTADTLNNLEQVLIGSPQSGEWTVRVVGQAVNDGSQGYALVATGGVTDASCIGDFDLSGAVDGDDIVAFFGAWDSGAAEADLDRSGGGDGDDVIRFFVAWDAGC